MSDWTNERVATLKAGFLAGKSFAEIARELGGVSRNACIGKAVRLKLTRGGDPKARHQIAAKIGTANALVRNNFNLRAPPVARAVAQNNGLNYPSRTPPRIHIAAATGRVYEQPADKPLKERQEPAGQVLLDDLQPHMCRWPIGTPGEAGFAFCGKGRNLAGPYCQGHHARAYTAERPRTEVELATDTKRRLAAIARSAANGARRHRGVSS